MSLKKLMGKLIDFTMNMPGYLIMLLLPATIVTIFGWPQIVASLIILGWLIFALGFILGTLPD